MKNKRLKIIGIAVAALMVIAAVCAVAYHFRPVFEAVFLMIPSLSRPAGQRLTPAKRET